MGVPPENIPTKMLFDEIALRIDASLQNAGHDLIGQPLLKPTLPLTPVQWTKLQSHQFELETEYDLRREMMLIRLDVDVQKLKVCVLFFNSARASCNCLHISSFLTRLKAEYLKFPNNTLPKGRFSMICNLVANERI